MNPIPSQPILNSSLSGAGMNPANTAGPGPLTNELQPNDLTRWAPDRVGQPGSFAASSMADSPSESSSSQGGFFGIIQTLIDQLGAMMGQSVSGIGLPSIPDPTAPGTPVSGGERQILT